MRPTKARGIGEKATAFFLVENYLPQVIQNPQVERFYKRSSAIVSFPPKWDNLNLVDFLLVFVEQ